MRKIILASLFTIATMMLSGCEVYSLVKDATDKEEGRILTTSGKTYQGRVEMPNVNTKNLTIITADSVKTVIKAEEIKDLIVWKKTHTDIKHVLHYLPSYWFGKDKERKPMWMALIYSGPYVDFYACSFNYSIPSNGDLKISSVKGGSIAYYALKKGQRVAKALHMTDYSKRSARKGLVEYFADDPVLCKKLTDLEIEPSDLETIAKQYKPSK